MRSCLYTRFPSAFFQVHRERKIESHHATVHHALCERGAIALSSAYTTLALHALLPNLNRVDQFHRWVSPVLRALLGPGRLRLLYTIPVCHWA